MAKKNAFTPIFSIREVIFPIFVEDAGGRCSAPEGHLRGRPALSGHSGTVPGAGRKSAGCREPRCHTRRETADSGGPRCHTRRETVGRDATQGGKRPAMEGHDAVFAARPRLYIGRRIPGPGAATLEKPGTATLEKPGTAMPENTKNGTVFVFLTKRLPSQKTGYHEKQNHHIRTAPRAGSDGVLLVLLPRGKLCVGRPLRATRPHEHRPGAAGAGRGAQGRGRSAARRVGGPAGRGQRGRRRGGLLRFEPL